MPSPFPCKTFIKTITLSFLHLVKGDNFEHEFRTRLPKSSNKNTVFIGYDVLIVCFIVPASFIGVEEPGKYHINPAHLHIATPVNGTCNFSGDRH